MAKVTRRRLLATSGMGAAAVSVLAATSGLRASQRHTATPTAQTRQSASTAAPSVVYIRDAAKGEVVLLLGTQEVIRTDPRLVAYLSRCCSSGAV
ncbi:MAG: hypothetical protein ACYDCQ_06000 [Dehalococcoidia bacterium]